MSSDVVAVRELGKSYRLFNRPQDRLIQGLWRRRQLFREFWALRGVSFSVRKGETVGIVGRNGSGKSTLLQIIAGTLTPTTGAVEVRGRVAALLELGAGFNPEFTGRENVLVNGSILGLSRAEIDSRFQEIVDFAEIGDFIDQPVRTYSSGMVVRLAFSVQANVPKDILIVDEVLAVGDEAFQRKCFSRLQEFKEEGGTVLFVSHDGGLVMQLCDRAILLEGGELMLQGRSKSVVHLYQRFAYAPPSAKEALLDEFRALNASPDWEKGGDAAAAAGEGETPAPISSDQPSVNRPALNQVGGYDPNLESGEIVRYEPRGVKICDPHITTTDGTKVNLLRAGEFYQWRYTVDVYKRITNVRFGMMIKTVSGIELGGRVSAPSGRGIAALEPGTRVKAQFDFRANLAPGTYYLNAGMIAIMPEGETFVDRWVDALIFKVLPEVDCLVTGFVDFFVRPRLLVEGKETEGASKVPDD